MPQRWTLRDRPITGPPQPTAHSSTLTITRSASTRPFPRKLQFRPARRVTRSELPFSCSQCHGSPASTWCPPCNAASLHLVAALVPDPWRHRFNPAAAPQPLTGPASPRLRSLARSTMGRVVRPTKVRLQHPTVPPEVPPVVQRAPRLPECRDRRPGCATVAARWHPHLVIALYCPQCPYFLPPPRLAPRGSANSSVSRIGFGKSLF